MRKLITIINDRRAARRARRGSPAPLDVMRPAVERSPNPIKRWIGGHLYAWLLSATHAELVKTIKAGAAAHANLERVNRELMRTVEHERRNALEALTAAKNIAQAAATDAAMLRQAMATDRQAREDCLERAEVMMRRCEYLTGAEAARLPKHRLVDVNDEQPEPEPGIKPMPSILARGLPGSITPPAFGGPFPTPRSDD